MSKAIPKTLSVIFEIIAGEMSTLQSSSISDLTSSTVITLNITLQSFYQVRCVQSHTSLYPDAPPSKPLETSDDVAK